MRTLRWALALVAGVTLAAANLDVKPAPAPVAVPGREDDARVAAIAFRLARAGALRCPRLSPGLGFVLQHLAQFRPEDRAGQAAAYALDRGPGVAAIVPGGPAAAAGVRPGDVLLAVAGVPTDPDHDLAAPFDQQRARERADRILDLIDWQGGQPFDLTLLRDGATVTVHVTPALLCPSRVHLARSSQLNAFADGVHVFLTSRLLAAAETDDQLAFVIAHEMAHNILGHAASLRAANVPHGIARALGKDGALVRRTEDEADALGAELMLDAGFDPVAGAQVLRHVGGTDFGIAFLGDHRSTSDRISVIRALAAARGRP